MQANKSDNKTNKKGLGRGLSALFALQDEIENVQTEAAKTSSNKGVTEIEISKISRNENQPRKYFDETLLNELADSIKSVGIIQPIVLREKDNGFYEIVAGERRFRAAIIAGLTSVPAIIKNITDREQKEMALIENLQRENLNPIEEAYALKALIDEYKISQTELAEILGKSRPVITNTLRLLSLDDFVINLVKENRLSSGHARALVSVSDLNTQRSYANAACDNKMSVRELELMVNKYLNPEPSKSKSNASSHSQSSDLKEFVHKLQHIFATKVKIIGNDNKGRIFIDYYTKDDLQRIYDLIDSLSEK